MTTINENIYESIREVNQENSDQNVKCEQMIPEEEVVSDRQTVDINVYFDVEKASINGELESSVRPVDEYCADNAINRAHRHVILRKIRITRGVSLVLALLTLMFFIGLILTIFSAFYLREEEIVLNDFEHRFTAEPLVDRNLSLDLFESNPQTEIIIKPDHDFNDEVSHPLPTTMAVTTTTTMATTSTTTDRPVTEMNDGFNYNTIEGLEYIAPDSGLRKFFEDLRNNRNEFNLQDIPPALDDVYQYFRRVFNLPRIRLEFDG